MVSNSGAVAMRRFRFSGSDRSGHGTLGVVLWWLRCSDLVAGQQSGLGSSLTKSLGGGGVREIGCDGEFQWVELSAEMGGCGEKKRVMMVNNKIGGR